MTLSRSREDLLALHARVQQAGVIPFVVFIVVTLLVLVGFKRVYPALAIGAAGAIITFLVQAPAASA